MADPHHRDSDPKSVRVAVVTVSDTRTEQTDESGKLLQDSLREAGHEIASYAVLPDEPDEVRSHVARLLDDGTAQVIVTSGGTGIGARDSTYEAIEELLEKRLHGFGEAFRRLSWDQVGAAAMLSRAVAGATRGAVIVALPGSRKAVQLALDELLLPELGHMAELARRTEPGRGGGSPREMLAARAGRLAEDVALSAGYEPGREAPESVVALYNRLRAEASDRLGEGAVAEIPRFGGGAHPSWGELAVLAGQLAVVCSR